jgi:uncharacterized membrane protein
MAAAGVSHFLRPGLYRRIVPDPPGHPATVVAVSGAAELACAALLALPRTRRTGARATAALLVAVFPANVKMALDGGYPEMGFPANNRLACWLRLPVQLPLVLWALSLRRPAAPNSA